MGAGQTVATQRFDAEFIGRDGFVEVSDGRLLELTSRAKRVMSDDNECNLRVSNAFEGQVVAYEFQHIEE